MAEITRNPPKLRNGQLADGSDSTRPARARSPSPASRVMPLIDLAVANAAAAADLMGQQCLRRGRPAHSRLAFILRVRTRFLSPSLYAHR